MQGVALANFFIQHMHKSFEYTSDKTILIIFELSKFSSPYSPTIAYVQVKVNQTQKLIPLTNTIQAAVKEWQPLSSITQKIWTASKTAYTAKLAILG